MGQGSAAGQLRETNPELLAVDLQGEDSGLSCDVDIGTFSFGMLLVR